MNIIRRAILAFALIAGIAPAIAQVPAPVPALPDTERRTSYSITASTCGCSVNFALYGDGTDYQNWLEVFVNGAQVSYNDPLLGWTITTPSGSIGTLARPITNAVLTFNTAQTGTVQIVGARRPRRISQFNEGAGVSARNLNQVFTDVIAMQRETWDKTNDVTGRAVLGRPGETLALLPALSSRANMGACFDSSGNLTSCVAAGSGSFIAGTGVTFTGTNPTTISAAQGAQLNGTNIWSGPQYFGNGRPWVDVIAFGCTPDSVTDNSPCIAAAISALVANYAGGIVYFPPGGGGFYCAFTGITVNNASVRLVGAGFWSRIAACGHDTNSLITGNANWVSVEQMYVCGKGAPCDPSDTTFGATHPAIYLSGSCGGCFVTNVIAYGGLNNLNIAGLAQVNGFSGGYSYEAVCTITGAVFWNLGSCNTQWPSAGVASNSLASVPARANATVYATNAIVTSGGWYLQAMSGGTSGGSPPTLKNFTQNITDGTVTWQIMSPTTNSAAMLVNGAIESYFNQLDMTGPMSNGLVVSAGSGVVKCAQCIASQTINSPVTTNGGLTFLDHLTTGPGVVLGNSGVQIGSQTVITGGQIIGDFGVRIQGGTGSSVTGASVGGTTQASFRINPAVSGVAMTGNTSFSANCFSNASADTKITFVGNVCGGGTIASGSAYAPVGANP